MIPERRTLARESNRIKVRVYESSKGFCVAWRSDRMRGLSMWYYSSEAQARKVARDLTHPVTQRPE